MRKRSSESWSSSGGGSASLSSMRASTTDKDDDVHGGGRRRLKRSSASLPVQRSSPASHHSWVLLNRAGARLDAFSGDRTTSAMSCTSDGEEFTVSFELVEPPGTSVLTLDWKTPRRTSANVIAAHRDVLLLVMASYKDTYPENSLIDLFVYQASRRPSLLLLPSAGGPYIYSHSLRDEEFGIVSCTSNGHSLLDGEIGIMCNGHSLLDGEIGIMSCTSNDVDDDSPSFVVAQLQITTQGTSNVSLFRSGSGQWESFQDLHVHGANGGRDLCWWSTDAVVAYRRRYMIWVDYYRGMVLMDLSSQSKTTRNPPSPPTLRYVPLPVDKVGDPKHTKFSRRGYPKACRAVCVTRYGIKFVGVDSQHWSNFGVGHADVLEWSHRFRITTWSLREDDCTWRKDAMMHEEEFWDVFDGGYRFPFPHVLPRFPVVDVDNPDVIIFQLEEPDYDDPKWMIKVDLRKKVLLAATAYSEKESDGLSCDAETINSVRMISGFDLIPSELPRYLYGGQASQASKKRRR